MWGFPGTALQATLPRGLGRWLLRSAHGLGRCGSNVACLEPERQTAQQFGLGGRAAQVRAVCSAAKQTRIPPGAEQRNPGAALIDPAGNPCSGKETLRVGWGTRSPFPETRSLTTHENTLPAALDRYEITLPTPVTARLEEYCRVLWDWNTRMNLTRHDTFDKFASRDVIDTLQLSALIPDGHEVLDVGSGGGIPGIVLQLIRPDLQVALSESVAKKARALNEMVEQLGLPMSVYHARGEDVLDDLRFDTIACRAVGPLWKICRWFEPHWHSFRQLLAIKGPRWSEERGEARHRGFLKTVELRCAAEYDVPGADRPSVILRLWQRGRTEPQGRSVPS